MEKRNDKTNTREGDKGKKRRTVSDDVGGKSLSDTSTSDKKSLLAAADASKQRNLMTVGGHRDNVCRRQR